MVTTLGISGIVLCLVLLIRLIVSPPVARDDELSLLLLDGSHG